MSKYSHELPQLKEDLFLTDGGLETTLVFHKRMELPCFAAFHLLGDDAGMRTLRQYFERYLRISRRHEMGFILETPTWRANSDWGELIGYNAAALAEVNRESVQLGLALRALHETPQAPLVISGNIGPRGDGYQPNRMMSVDEARAYHHAQIETFAGTEADMVSAFTLNYVEEAIGIVQAAREVNIPAVISFTVETDGRLPTGQTLEEAIRRTDEATDGHAAYYMINCAHPTHFADTLNRGGGWLQRLRGLRANASCLSHAELDDSEELDEGNPQELGRQYAELLERFPQITVLGGCCGTDERHISQIAAACRPVAEAL